ncbi:MAG: HNH endonuclease, partial [Solobacterium sp.]|nr:HNH endonuclease [Solobacterium sp.]
IMPRHPNKWWLKNAGMTDEDDYTNHVNLIGNLTLCAIYDNTKMGNEDFAFKKKVLSKTLHIRMNTSVLKKKTWTKEDILKRCNDLAEEIIRIYPYNGTKDAGRDTGLSLVNDDDIIILTAPTVNARAIFHSLNDIEVLSGSTMKAYGNREMKTNKEIFRSLYEQGILREDDEGRIQFEQSRHFSSLNEAAQFLMHRGGDNTNAWTNEDGSVIDLSKKEKKAAPVKKKQPVIHKKKQNKPEKKEEPKKITIRHFSRKENQST